MSIAPIPDPRPEPRPAPRAPWPDPAPVLPLVDPHTAVLDGTDDLDRVAARTALALARATCDVAARRRTRDQLRVWSTPAAQAALGAWAGRRGPQGPWSVRSLRAQHPAEGVLECAVRLAARSGRSTALALRLELRGARWVCVTAEAGPSRS